MSIDQTINEFFAPISKTAFDVILYAVPVAGQDVRLLLVWLAAAAVFFTVYFGFINVRYFKHAIDIVVGKFDKPNDEGHINSWQALMASMSGTVGLGNIAGVAVAVSLGGPGAVFWMIVIGFLSMSTKFVEVTLGVKYRKIIKTETGTRISGGPMYYLEEAFKHYNIPYLGKVFAVLFAVSCVLGSIGGGSIFQSNQAFQQLYTVSGADIGFLADKAWLFGVFMAFLVGVVIIGGIKSIAAVASRLVPFMAALYIILALFVIIGHANNIIPTFVLIISEAFNFQAGIGAVLGSFLVGMQRAAFSNEAGMGTAPIVYSATKAHEPVSQGLASMLGPFIDTVIVCTFTALLILISGVYEPGADIQGIELTSNALSQGADWFPYALAFIVFLFAYSSLITFAYLSAKCVTYLFGDKKWIDTTYKVLYCLLAIVGCTTDLTHAINFTDAAFLSVAIPNIVGLYLLAPIVKKDLKAYLENFKKTQS